MNQNDTKLEGISLQNCTKLEGIFVIPAKEMPLLCLQNNGGFTKKRTKKQIMVFWAF